METLRPAGMFQMASLAPVKERDDAPQEMPLPRIISTTRDSGHVG